MVGPEDSVRKAADEGRKGSASPRPLPQPTLPLGARSAPRVLQPRWPLAHDVRVDATAQVSEADSVAIASARDEYAVRQR